MDKVRRDEMILISVYSYYKILLRHGRKVHPIGSMMLIKGETENEAKERAFEMYAPEIETIRKGKDEET